MVLGGVAGGVIALIGVFLVRRQPEDMGLLPDDDPPEEAAAGGAAERSLDATPPPRRRDEYPWTRSEAVRTGVFWRLSLVFGLQMFAASTGVFRVPYFVDRGIDAQMVAFSLSLNAAAGACMAIPLGFLMDRVQLRYPAMVGLLFTAGAFLVAMATTSPWQMFVSSALFGAGAGTMMITQITMWPVYFGRANVGSIRGLAFPMILAFSAVGAPLTGMVRDSSGSYFLAWWIAVAGLFLAAVIMLFTPRPRPRAVAAAPLLGPRAAPSP